MQTTIILLVVTQLVIAAAATLAPRLKIPAPLILVFAGICVSLVPAVPEVAIDPNIILIGLLPPLLYASATSVPVVNFRRELIAINGLSVVLVVLSSLVLGAALVWLIPGLGFGWGVALGAILSPTDAVAVGIIKGRGVPGRVAVILEGESLLNDASALILLRTAIAGTSLGFSFLATLGAFAWSVGVAVAVGLVAARLSLAIRCRVRDEAVNTMLSFTTPFVAAIPAELLHGSGLVAAVVAGFAIGLRAKRALPPGHRVSDARNWATVEIGLEGVIFLTMGLQLSTILRNLTTGPVGLGRALGIAALVLVVTVAVRGLYVVLLLWRLQGRTERDRARQPRVVQMQHELEAGRVPEEMAKQVRRWRMDLGERMLKQLIRRGRRNLADLDYFARQRLGAGEGAVVVWAGMRGAVTVAAAQLLPSGTPHRSLLVFIAFAVATLSLLIQGGTIGLVAGHLFPSGASKAESDARDHELSQIRTLLAKAAADVERRHETPDKDHRLVVLRAQRIALLDAADDGVFGADALDVALRDLDIDELVLELRSGVTESP
jgi:NhaP-type Na+/H+ or K+/H+ antiporter